MWHRGPQVLFLQSYLPENKSSNFFFLQRNDLLIDVMKEITDHILKQEVVVNGIMMKRATSLSWESSYWETFLALKLCGYLGCGLTKWQKKKKNKESSVSC